MRGAHLDSLGLFYRGEIMGRYGRVLGVTLRDLRSVFQCSDLVETAQVPDTVV